VEFLDLAFHDFHAFRIQLQTVSCYRRTVPTPIQTLCPTAIPFISTLAAQGDLSYPLFGLSLTQNATGSLAIGAIDSSVVKNVSKIVWNEVVPFAPLDSTDNVSSYLQWAIRLASFAVRCILLNRNPILIIRTGQWRSGHTYAYISKCYPQLIPGLARCVCSIFYQDAQ
jgi:hypothetical protein